MKFQASNLKGTFIILKAIFLILCFLFAILYLCLLCAIVTSHLKNPESIPHIQAVIIAPLCVLTAIELVFAIAIKKLSKACREAEKYMLGIEDSTIHIVCDGVKASVAAYDIESFDILPRGCEPNSLRTKWTETAVIKTRTGEVYRLYYLKNIRHTKILFKAVNKIT